MSSFLDLLDQHTAAAKKYRDLVSEEMLIEDSRPLVKYAAIGRIMGSENAVTKKPHSASSAEAIVETDGEYWALLKKKRETVAAKLGAQAALESARYRVQHALAVIATLRGGTE